MLIEAVELVIDFPKQSDFTWSETGEPPPPPPP